MAITDTSVERKNVKTKNTQITMIKKEKTAEKKRYVFRFYRRAWTDIVVEAADEDEACELANEKYNDGDYDGSDEDFENEGCEDVTGTYIENGIDF